MKTKPKIPVKPYCMKMLAVILCVATLTGCSAKPKENGEILNNSEPVVTSTTTTAGNSSSTAYSASPIVDSYTRYLDEKNKAIDLLNTNVTGDNAIYLMQVAGIALMDIMVMHVSVCGVAEADAMMALKFMGVMDAVYEYKENDCRITYKDGERGELSIHALHDPATDSMQFTVTSNGTVSLKYEYAKMKQGYASQYQSFDDGATDVVMINFKSDEVRLAIFNSDRFDSIYRKSNLSINDVPETGLFIHFVDGVATVSDNS